MTASTTRQRVIRGVRALAAIVAIAAGTVATAAAGPARAADPPTPAHDPFYTYDGHRPLADIAPGTVLKTRTTTFHLAGVDTPISVVQLLYRSQTVQRQPTTNVTSVLLPPTPSATPQLVGYGSFYDSLGRSDEPSYVFSGAPYSSDRELPTIEAAIIAPLLLAGDTVSVADTEGQHPDFAAGPEYGMLTLDGLRAALSSSATGLADTQGATPVALMGYSGGAIATGWAAQMAPTYAPDINSRLVGAALGGVLVEPDHNLHYVDGSSQWAGVIPMALIGVARAYHLDLTPYLSAYGRQVYAALSHAAIGTAESDYPNLTFAQLVKHRYATPESIPVFVHTANKLILGHDALPTVPLFITQGDDGTADGTSNDQPGIGPGDGVMIAGDVRTYASEACAAGDPVDYTELPLTHEATEVPWTAGAVAWLASRFAGTSAPDDCNDIAPGNPLDPVAVQPAG